MNPQLLAIRIKDGVFVGNGAASKDESWLTLNKVSAVINCAGHQLVNGFPTVRYLTFFWDDNGTSTLFDAPAALHRVQEFVDQALSAGECVLVHSMNGLNRASTLVVAYLMCRYAWCMDSALDFLEVAHPDANIHEEYVTQLRQLEAHVSPHEDRDIMHPQVDTAPFSLDNEQWLLRNTFLNSLPIDHYRSAAQRYIAEADAAAATKPRTQRIKFVEASAPLFSFSARPYEGGILSSGAAPLTRKLESDDPCPLGPWTFVPLEETEGYDHAATQHPPAVSANTKKPPPTLTNESPAPAPTANPTSAQFARSSEGLSAGALAKPESPADSSSPSRASSTLDPGSFASDTLKVPKPHAQTQSPDTPSLSRRPAGASGGSHRSSPRRSSLTPSPSASPPQSHLRPSGSPPSEPMVIPGADAALVELKEAASEHPPPRFERVHSANAPSTLDVMPMPVLRPGRDRPHRMAAHDAQSSTRGSVTDGPSPAQGASRAAAPASPPMVAWAAPGPLQRHPLPVAQQYRRVAQSLVRQASMGGNGMPRGGGTPRGVGSPTSAGGPTPTAFSPRVKARRYDSPRALAGEAPAVQRIFYQHGVRGPRGGAARTNSRERGGTTPRDHPTPPGQRPPPHLHSPTAEPHRRRGLSQDHRQPSKRVSGTFASPRPQSATHASPRGYDRHTAATMNRMREQGLPGNRITRPAAPPPAAVRRKKA
eukprot:TRINITY_DN6445_c0_g1_i1.p1 TRINITY_DN6445_c0_g1~~TRINITY_DN6445_c0_g1_i1.p1  ORF type:complete len:708 (+),score=127.78 TRINITY_DN6445_c0_g1_i1:68-2191(+)